MRLSSEMSWWLVFVPGDNIEHVAYSIICDEIPKAVSSSKCNSCGLVVLHLEHLSLVFRALQACLLGDPIEALI